MHAYLFSSGFNAQKRQRILKTADTLARFAITTEIATRAIQLPAICIERGRSLIEGVAQLGRHFTLKIRGIKSKRIQNRQLAPRQRNRPAQCIIAQQQILQHRQLTQRFWNKAIKPVARQI
mmetsp:Transcript_3398/g.7769  ORF Transcript_3398/g.7769 Transcript_3398/m.7769 type:complete len:121 (-) Transcript_3398:692-1054(-)